MSISNLDYNYTVENLPKDLDKLKIKSIKRVGKKPVYEITVDKAHSYVLRNGVIKTNTGLLYAANTVFFITKAQEKEGSEIAGWTFTLVVDKSRFVKEKSKIPITVKFDSGIDIYTGLLEIAQNTGHVIKPNQGWYSRVIDGVVEDKKWRAKDTSTKEFWQVLLDDPSFDEEIGKIYKVALSDMVDPSELSEEEIIDQIDD